MAKRTRHGNGQLRSMDLTPAQVEARKDKIAFRQSVSREHGITRGIAMATLQVLQRGFFGRLKWLVVGK